MASMTAGETGSAIYMSPEVRQSKPYNEKIDIFAFGVVLFEVFSRNLIMASLKADAGETTDGMTCMIHVI